MQSAIHANTTSLPYPWDQCSNVVDYSRFDLLSSMLPVYKVGVGKHTQARALFCVCRWCGGRTGHGRSPHLPGSPCLFVFGRILLWLVGCTEVQFHVYFVHATVLKRERGRAVPACSQDLIAAKLKMLVFSGDVDAIVPVGSCTHVGVRCTLAVTAPTRGR